MQFDIIAAVDSNWGLSKEGVLPWRKDPQGRMDMNYFKKLTYNSTVIMGRKTWESIGKPLPNRVNVIISSKSYDDTIQADTFEAALDWYTQNGTGRCFVIGGANVYAQALNHKYLRRAYISHLDGDYQCDLFFPLVILPKSSTTGIFNIYDFTKPEQAYLDLMKRLIGAPVRPNRTGIPTRGLFHEVIKFDLSDNRGRIIPLITTKFTHWISIYHELIWFLRGSTDTKYLEDHNVKIWCGNTSREYLDSRELSSYAPGETGPVYGYQWRNWGGDQLARVIETINTHPGDRRMIVSAWNVDMLAKMALPPCHYAYQFHVDFDSEPKKLNCAVNMRSADVALGVPFNIASYALLTHMISIITGLSPGVLSISMVDCHIYENHIDGAKLMIDRKPYRPARLELSDRAKNAKNIDEFAYVFDINDYNVADYVHHPAIKLTMAV